MKVRNLYYHTVFKRTNSVKVFILQVFLALASWFRVFIEVFTRKKFGERYFLFPLNIMLAVILGIVPLGRYYGTPVLAIIFKNLTWYAYIVAFMIASYKRYLEVKREPSVFDFKRFSLSPGIIKKWLYKIDLIGMKMTNRNISIFVEPGIFMLIGMVLVALQQDIGYLLISSATVYGYSWAAQYYLGDQFIMDTIDQMIANEELVNSFVHTRIPADTRGFEVDASKIKSREFRRMVAENMMESEPAVDVI